MNIQQILFPVNLLKAVEQRTFLLPYTLPSETDADHKIKLLWSSNTLKRPFHYLRVNPKRYQL